MFRAGSFLMRFLHVTISFNATIEVVTLGLHGYALVILTYRCILFNDIYHEI